MMLAAFLLVLLLVVTSTLKLRFTVTDTAKNRSAGDMLKAGDRVRIEERAVRGKHSASVTIADQPGERVKVSTTFEGSDTNRDGALEALGRLLKANDLRIVEHDGWLYAESAKTAEEAA